MNNHGQLAFMARLAGGADGIFVGPNPAMDAVIRAGDPLDGSTVQFLSMSQNALNDSGQIVFTADLTDGRRGVYVFTPVPVPEPGGLLVVAGLGLLAVAKRRLPGVFGLKGRFLQPRPERSGGLGTGHEEVLTL